MFSAEELACLSDALSRAYASYFRSYEVAANAGFTDVAETQMHTVQEIRKLKSRIDAARGCARATEDDLRERGIHLDGD